MMTSLYLIISLLCVISTQAWLADTFLPILNGAEDFFNQLNGGIRQIVKKIRSVSDFINDTIEEECVYRCPDGSKPKLNKSHVSKPNGCGSLGFEVPEDNLPISELRNCCDIHDICYDTCNSDKEKCDKNFRKCLYKICEQYKKVIGENLHTGCKATAQAMYSGTIAFGCKPYKDSQKQACLCPRKKSDL